jgi:hypothetical protein
MEGIVSDTGRAGRARDDAGEVRPRRGTPSVPLEDAAGAVDRYEVALAEWEARQQTALKGRQMAGSEYKKP